MFSNELYTPRSKRGGDDNMIPLVNIVFLMLVFYMIAGQITDPRGRNIDPPVSSSKKPLVHAPVVLILETDNSLSINGKPVTYESLDADILGATNAGSEGVIVKADKEVKAKNLDRLFEILRQLQISKVTLFSRPEES